MGRKIFSLFLGFLLILSGISFAWAEQNKRLQLKEKFTPRNVRQMQNYINLDQQTWDAGQGQQVANEAIAQCEQSRDNRRPQDTVIGEYAIYQSEYQAEIEEEIAFIKAKVNFEVFKRSGLLKIPLVSSNVGLKDVSLNRKPSFVVRRGSQYWLIIDKPGLYTLDLEFFVKVQRERERGPGSVTFKVLPSPISILDVEMAENQVEIFVEPSIKIETEKLSKKTLATVVLPFTEMVTVRWSKALPKEDIPKAVLEPKIYVDESTLVSVGDGVAKCFTTLHYSILQSEVSSLRVSLPEEVGILDVSSSQLRDWKVKTEDGRQFLDVYLNYGVKGSYHLNITYEKSIGAGSVTAELPEIRAVGAERQRGFLGIEARTNIELAFNKLSGASTVDVKELPQQVWSRARNPVILAFKYLKVPYQAVIDVTKHKEVAVLVAAIDSSKYVTLFTEEGKVLTKATYQMRNNVKQFVRLSLPDDASLWSCFVSGKPVKPAKDKQGRILVPLEKSQVMGEALTQFPVEVVYLIKNPQLGFGGKLKMNLPKLDIPQNELFWSVFLPEMYKYFKFDGDVKETKRIRQVFAPVAARLEEGKKGVYRRKSQMLYAKQAAPQEIVMLDEIQQAKVQGVLPIKINVPESGKVFRFSKLLVTEESPWMSAFYLRSARPSAVIIWIIILGTIIGVMLKKKKAQSREADL